MESIHVGTNIVANAMRMGVLGGTLPTPASKLLWSRDTAESNGMGPRDSHAASRMAGCASLQPTIGPLFTTLLFIMFVARGDASKLRVDAAGGPAVRSIAPFGSISLSQDASRDALPASREPRTGTLYPGDFCLRAEHSHCPVLVGTG